MRYTFPFLLLAMVCAAELFAGANDIGTVTLHRQQIRLSEALQQVSQQTGLHLVYPDAIVDSLFVSCNFDELTAEQAIKRLLRKTSISYRRKGPAEIVIFLKRQPLTIDLTGSVYDAETKEKLPYANISLKGSGRGTSTDLQGGFLLPAAPFQTCTLKVTYIGYASREVVIDRAHLTAHVDVDLVQRSILGETVTVVPHDWQLIAPGDEAGVIAVAPENMSLLPGIGDQDVLKTLQLLPGVSSTQGAAELSIRGGTPSQNLVLFDGMTLYHLDHSFGFFSAFNADAIKDVRIYKSGMPAKYGGRLSGVTEITTRAGNTEQPRLQIGANLLNAHSVLEAPIAGAGALLLSLRRSYSSYIIDELYERNFTAFTSSIPRRQAVGNNPLPQLPQQGMLAAEPDISFYDVIAKASVTTGERDRVSLSLYASQDDLQRFESRAQTIRRQRQPHDRSASTFVRQEQAEWGNRGASVSWFRQWRERWQTTAMAAYSRFSSEQTFFENAPAFAPDPRFRGQMPASGSAQDSVVFEISSDNTIRDATFRLDNTLRPHAAHKLEFGSWISHTRIGYSTSGLHIIDNLQQEAQATQASFYIQDNWYPNAALLLSAGLRATYYDLTATTYLEPRWSGSLQLAPALTLKTGWSRTHQFVRRLPGFFQYTDGRDFWVLADGRAIEPGFAEHWVGGVTLGNRNLSLDLEYYESHQQDVLEGIPAVQYMAPQERTAIYDNSTGLARGLDVLLQKTGGRFSGWIGYSHSKTTIEADVQQQVQEFPANQDMRHKLNLVGSFAHRGWNLSATWSYASGAPFTEPQPESTNTPEFGELVRLVAPARLNAGRLPATHRLDLSLTRAFETRHVSGHIGFSLYNVYDHDNIWYRNYVLENGEVAPDDVMGLGMTPGISVDLRLR